VVSAAGKAPHGALATLPTDSTRELFESKFWSAYHCAKHIGPMLRAGGAIVFVAGVLNRRPGMNCSPLASTNGALEGLTRALALEWGPQLRVNCLRYVCVCVF
jgi:NAD(P)-dependent dehydrogenase (short-subunit alcohol dehydrogenase family)